MAYRGARSSESVLKLRWPPRSCVPVAIGRRFGSLRRMGELDLATVAAANDAWVLAPEGSEGSGDRGVSAGAVPGAFSRSAAGVVGAVCAAGRGRAGEVIVRAAGFGLPEAFVYVKLSARRLRRGAAGCGARLVDTSDVLAVALPADVKASDLPGPEVRRLTATEVARDANTVGVSVFGGSRASDDELARRAAAYRATVAAGTGGAVVAYSTAPRSHSRASRLPTAWPGCGAAQCWRRTAAATSIVRWLPLA
jgi:hypothetical protein